MTFRQLIRTPSGFLPLMMSAAALALVLGYVALLGLDAEPKGDEGATARLFQLILAVQSVVMVSFAASMGNLVAAGLNIRGLRRVGVRVRDALGDGWRTRFSAKKVAETASS